MFTVLLAFFLGLGIGVLLALYPHFIFCKATLSIFRISLAYAPPRVAYSHFVSHRYFKAAAIGIQDNQCFNSSYVAIDLPTNPDCPVLELRAFTIQEFKRSSCIFFILVYACRACLSAGQFPPCSTAFSYLAESSSINTDTASPAGSAWSEFLSSWLFLILFHIVDSVVCTSFMVNPSWNDG